jgi:hypothetical protein
MPEAVLISQLCMFECTAEVHFGLAAALTLRTANSPIPGSEGLSKRAHTHIRYAMQVICDALEVLVRRLS